MSSRRLAAAAKKSTTKIANTIFTAPNIAFTKAMNKWNKGGETPLWRCSFYRPFQCFLLLSSFQRRWAYYSTFTAGAGAELHRKCGGFAPLVDEHTEQMDAPPYGRAVSDAPPHSGLSPIAVFRHYCSRHLICIVPFTRRGPSLHRHYPASLLLWPHPTPRFAFATARPPKFLTELSRRVVLLCPAAPARPKPIRALGVGFTASELLAARNSSNETLRRRFICIATHLFVRQDSRIRVAPLTACRPNHISVCL